MPNRITEPEVCDATEDDSSNAAWFIITDSSFIGMIIHVRRQSLLRLNGGLHPLTGIKKPPARTPGEQLKKTLAKKGIAASLERMRVPDCIA